LAILGVALIAPAGASADSVKIGSTLQSTQNASFGSYSEIQLAYATPHPLVSPANGVITAWGIRTGFSDTYSLLVMHPKSGGGFDVTGGAVAPGPTDGTPDKTYIYSAPSVPIAKGDSIGLLNPSTNAPLHNTGNPLDIAGGNAVGPPTIPGSVGAPDANPGRELLLQAAVKFCNACNGCARGEKAVTTRPKVEKLIRKRVTVERQGKTFLQTNSQRIMADKQTTSEK